MVESTNFTLELDNPEITQKSFKNRQVLASQPRIVLVDDDPIFVAIMKQWAIHEGVHLESFYSLKEIKHLDLFSNFDAAILDYDLGDQTGMDIAFESSCHSHELPIVIISYKDRSRECVFVPDCVKAVLLKSEGYRYILEVASRCCA